ncbi:MAG: hypothetical protein VBE63_01640 [Lamprobacter sp.]|uniref:hypothetical protein n=1 Tax=Lamprobacter sp. TaxID=3100796 RepID=UPI002B256B99|nr:hypothetical protein [Lamprobacter sp.]MEA3638629.1 hypothetical protein [Lamprobacter sp.]
MQRQHPTSLSRGEARIKRAFILSALIIAGLLAIALLALWLTRGEDTPAPIEDAEIATLIITWPDGREQTQVPEQVDRLIRIEQPKPLS